MSGLAAAAKDPKMPINVVVLNAETIAPFARSVPLDATSPPRTPVAARDYQIQPGDVLRITIFEATDGGLFKTMQNGGNVFDQLRVSAKGDVILPYIGRVQAGGKTRDQVREQIMAGALAGLASQPAVMVDVVTSNAMVYVSGDVKTPGAFSLVDGPQTVLDAIDKAGGPAQPSFETDVIVRNGQYLERIPMYDLLVAGGDRQLQPGDDIVVQAHLRQFIAMGAVAKQGIQEMQMPAPSLLDVLGQVGGLVDTQADPTGVFVFRGTAINPEPMPSLSEETAARTPVASASESSATPSARAAAATDVSPGDQPGTSGGSRLDGTSVAKREVIVLDMSKPQALFLARSFTVQPHDVIYVTNAPLYQFGKIISLVLQTGGIANNAKALSTGFSGL
jgi:polysaccharide export outer membrane protein